MIANATNRITVLLGSAMATYSFHREKQLDWKAGIKLAPSALIGSSIYTLHPDLCKVRVELNKC